MKSCPVLKCHKGFPVRASTASNDCASSPKRTKPPAVVVGTHPEGLKVSTVDADNDLQVSVGLGCKRINPVDVIQTGVFLACHVFVAQVISLKAGIPVRERPQVVDADLEPMR